MTEKTVEYIFGANAGIVWEALKEKGPCTIADLARTTSLSREEFHGALGWLGRENKISAKTGDGGKGRKAIVFYLQP
jgi:predicted ArsR family transcriptional regulator